MIFLCIVWWRISAYSLPLSLRSGLPTLSTNIVSPEKRNFSATKNERLPSVCPGV
jgi:hypothetical protein